MGYPESLSSATAVLARRTGGHPARFNPSRGSIEPIGLLNTAGYYNGLLDFLETSVEQPFLGDWQTE
nr:LOG family protein [Rhodoferax sp. UBA5149]